MFLCFERKRASGAWAHSDLAVTPTPAPRFLHFLRPSPSPVAGVPVSGTQRLVWQGRWRPQAAPTGPLVWGGWGVCGGGVGLSGGSEGEVARSGEMTAPGTGPAAPQLGLTRGTSVMKPQRLLP